MICNNKEVHWGKAGRLKNTEKQGGDKECDGETDKQGGVGRLAQVVFSANSFM